MRMHIVVMLSLQKEIRGQSRLAPLKKRERNSDRSPGFDSQCSPYPVSHHHHHHDDYYYYYYHHYYYYYYYYYYYCCCYYYCYYDDHHHPRPRSTRSLNSFLQRRRVQSGTERSLRCKNRRVQLYT